MIAQELLEMDRADLLFALDEGDDIDRRPRLVVPGAQGLDVAPDLPLVINRAAGEDGVEAVFVLADGGVEGGRFPLIKRLGGLDVVVAVEEDCGAVGLRRGSCENNGV